MSSRIAWVNAVDTSTLTEAGSDFSNLPIANLADYRIKKVWRTSTISSFTSTFAASQTIAVLALAGCTASAGDTVRHRLYDASNTLLYDTRVGSTDIDIGIVSGYGRHFHVPSTAVAAVKKWTCNVDAHASLGYSPPDGTAYLDIGRAWASDAWTPGIGYDVGVSEGEDDNLDIQRAPVSGIVFPGDGTSWDTLDVKFSWLTDAEHAIAKDFRRNYSRAKQILFIPDTSGDMPRNGLIGRRTATSPIVQEVNVVPAAYTFTLSLAQDQ